MAADPYAAPKSRVADIPNAAPDGEFVAEGRGVAAGNGWTWISDAWGMFKGQKGTWIGLFVILAVIIIVLNILPIIGPLLLILLSPVLYGGVMLGCEAQRSGDSLEIGHLFAGFRSNTGRLIGVGAVTLLAFIGVFVVVMVIFGVDMARMMMGAKPSPEQLQALGTSFLLIPLIILALSLPIYMAIWFATPLIVLNDCSVGDALKASFAACLKNILPFLVFGIVFFLLAIVATIPLALGWLALGPVLLASIYTAYRDIFYER
ncbi:MAG: hypothetical protein HY067_09890 [Betaproteobacteria bacterium]|nr:hypothetical protein [Betaproteobacteria bacterium]